MSCQRWLAALGSAGRWCGCCCCWSAAGQSVACVPASTCCWVRSARASRRWLRSSTCSSKDSNCRSPAHSTWSTRNRSVWRASDSSRRELTGEIRNESAPIQPAHCRFHGQAFSNAEILAYKIYGSNFIKQHSETVMVSNYQNANCRFKKKKLLSFIVIFGTLSFPMSALDRGHTDRVTLDTDLWPSVPVSYVHNV